MATAVGVFGVSYGVLSRGAGVPLWITVALSATVFAGSSQFAAVSILAGGGTVASAVASGALLNARYLATGAAAARVLPGGRWRRFLRAQLVVDESFALGVAAGTPGRPDGRAMVRAGAALWSSWVVGSLLGALLGPVVGDPTRLGLDAAFPALFVALLWPLLRSPAGRLRDDPGADEASGRSEAPPGRPGRPAVRSALAGLAAAAVMLPVSSPGLALAGAAVAGLATSGRGADGRGEVHDDRGDGVPT
jgi:4-azaleucine resistance transporter AzlC